MSSKPDDIAEFGVYLNNPTIESVADSAIEIQSASIDAIVWS